MSSALAVKIVTPIVIDSTKLTTTNVSGTAEGASWLAATAYTIGNRVYRPNNKLYERLISGTTATAPEGDSINWILVSPTNPYRMFDASNSSQTSNATSINVRVTPAAIANTLALFNMDGTSVTVAMNDPVAGSVYSQTFSLQSPPIAPSWYAYFFDPIKTKRDLVVSLPSYINAYTDVTITKAAGTAKCGTMILGNANLVGLGINYGASVGIIDYSTKEKNTFGDYNIVPRGFAKRANFTIMLENSEVDPLIDLLSDLRTTPTLFIGSTQFTSTAIFGYYKDFDINLQYTENSICTITLEGLS